MNWRRSDIFDLLSMYRESECLWNYLNPEYKDLDLKKNAWKEIANFFDRSVEEVKKKIKNLRTSYVLEKKKVDSKRAEAEDYNTSLFYYDEMNFLDNIIVLRGFNAIEQNADPLSEIKPRRSTNERLVETKKRKMSSNTQEDMAYLELTPAKRKLRDKNDVYFDNVLQDDLEKEDRLSKEYTFCAMLYSELKLLKSEDIYDNVTTEIFTILRNAKMTERQIEYQPEENNKVAGKKM